MFYSLNIMSGQTVSLFNQNWCRVKQNSSSSGYTMYFTSQEKLIFVHFYDCYKTGNISSLVSSFFSEWPKPTLSSTQLILTRHMIYVSPDNCLLIDSLQDRGQNGLLNQLSSVNMSNPTMHHSIPIIPQSDSTWLPIWKVHFLFFLVL